MASHTRNAMAHTGREEARDEGPGFGELVHSFLSSLIPYQWPLNRLHLLQFQQYHPGSQASSTHLWRQAVFEPVSSSMSRFPEHLLLALMIASVPQESGKHWKVGFPGVLVLGDSSLERVLEQTALLGFKHSCLKQNTRRPSWATPG